ncbi:MAG TPA: hypothetical protein VKR56_03850 [Candidatus Cybelea sp.]|nr:hypothetical protein [Candidatus Cybelea sp.]
MMAGIDANGTGSVRSTSLVACAHTKTHFEADAAFDGVRVDYALGSRHVEHAKEHIGSQAMMKPIDGRAAIAG